MFSKSIRDSLVSTPLPEWGGLKVKYYQRVDSYAANVSTPLPEWGGLKEDRKIRVADKSVSFNTPPGVGRVESDTYRVSNNSDFCFNTPPGVGRVESVYLKSNNPRCDVSTPLPEWGGFKYFLNCLRIATLFCFNTPPGVGRVER